MALLGTSKRRERAAQAPQRRGQGRGHRPEGPRPPIVELHQATVVYPGGHVGLERVSLQVHRGEFAFVVGPTGCGKSTLIRLLIREVEAAAGSV